MKHQNSKKWIVGTMTGAALVMGSAMTTIVHAVVDVEAAPGSQGACVVTFKDETQSCYQWHHQGDEACKATVGTTFTPPGETVTSAKWNPGEKCSTGTLLATGVELTATKNAAGGVDLTLTTTAEPGTAAMLILRGDQLGNGGTEIDVACSFASGGSPYTCTDAVAADTYRAAEIEYDGSLIIYGEVTSE